MGRKPLGKLRLYIDPLKPLSEALKISHYPLQKKFMVNNGFWHRELDEPSSHLTTLATPFGRYCWVWMPISFSPAPEEFQCKLNQALE